MAKPRRGVAPIRAASKNRISIASRLSREIYDKLEIEAKRNGRSLSEEIETRLERSFNIVGLVEMLTTNRQTDKIGETRQWYWGFGGGK